MGPLPVGRYGCDGIIGIVDDPGADPDPAARRIGAPRSEACLAGSGATGIFVIGAAGGGDGGATTAGDSEPAVLIGGRNGALRGVVWTGSVTGCLLAATEDFV